MAKRIVCLRTSSLLGSRHAWCWRNSMLGHAMQLGVTNSARFAAPHGNQFRVTPLWQLRYAACNGATQLQVTPRNLA